MEYRIKPFSGEVHKDFAELDKKRKEKVEKALGKKLNDCEWLNYKRMTMPKSERQK